MDEQHNYDIIAPFYDVEHAPFREDLDMYLNYAELSGGAILELACGSGRVLLPLAREGYMITGVDSSAHMLALARQQVQHAGLAGHCMLIEQDMRMLQLERKFRLAFIALGSFAHMTTRKDQQRVLQALRAHLGMGSTCIIDISNADARYMEDLGGHVLHQGTWRREDGTMLTHFYDQHQQGGNVQRTVVTTHLYLFERGEMELLLEQAGFAVKEVYGHYDLSPFQLDSPRMIFLAEAR